MRARWLLLLTFLPALAAAGQLPVGKFANHECVNCHTNRDAQLVAAWRASSHARTTPKVDCITCHGPEHRDSLARARRDSACMDCHEKLNRTVTHSYATSKHATIVRLEEDRWDWSRPLARGNYRAPGCAYCHLHAGEHNTRLSVMPWDAFKATDESARTAILGQRQPVCGECHAPRYVAEQTDMGLRTMDIARMKLREGRELVTRYRNTLPAEERRALDTLFGGMQTHGHNVRLGVGHQSPDYQWWHGHPALDGDLLRIKGVMSGMERHRVLPPDVVMLPVPPRN